MIKVIRNYTLDDIIASIKYLLDKASYSPEVRQHAINITYDKQDKIAAIYDWLKSDFYYIPDPIGAEGEEIELFISPVKLVKDYNLGLKPAGDCDDCAIFATSLARVSGIKSNIVIIGYGNGFEHAYSGIWSDKLNIFISVDPTAVGYPLGWVFPYKERLVIE